MSKRRNATIPSPAFTIFNAIAFCSGVPTNGAVCADDSSGPAGASSVIGASPPIRRPAFMIASAPALVRSPAPMGCDGCGAGFGSFAAEGKINRGASRSARIVWRRIIYRHSQQRGAVSSIR